ncbi:efflux transporter outer membrane subunit [Legionella spiritensis]|uniref:efflux transporter outer membrane subunit n=1 Tax=Legionella spiritensis TaxID=452 RepID=UPI000F84AD00|nr:efflux transporter outer membrane subunit [Legionella spiritensis]
MTIFHDMDKTVPSRLRRQHKKIISFIVLVSCLSACTLSLDKKQIQQHVSKVPAMDRSVKSYLQGSSAMKSGSWPKEQWWESLQLPQLNALVAAGLKANPDLNALRARLNAAIEESNISRAERSPWVRFHAKTNEQYRSKNGLYRALNPNIPLDGHEVDFNVSFNYEFDFWGKYYNRFQEAVGYKKAKEAELAEARLLTAVSISEYYLKYQAAVSKLALSQRLRLILQKEEALQTILLNKNLDSEFPVLDTRLQKESVGQIIADLRTERLRYQHVINRMLARDPEQPIAAVRNFKPLPRRLDVPKNIELNLVSRRPDLMARIWEAQARANRVGAAMADFYPNINLIGLAGMESVAWQKLLELSSVTALLRPAVSLPLYTAGAIRANVRKNYAQFNEAVFAYNAALFAAVSEVMDSLAQMRSSHTSFLLEQKKLAAAGNELRLSKIRQNAGIDNQLQIYFFEKKLIENKIENVDKNLAQYLAALRLILSLGGGYCNQDIPIKKET